MTIRPPEGRHRIRAEFFDDDEWSESNSIEFYVLAEEVEPGFRANLGAVRSDPSSWPQALALFDRLILQGHDDLKLGVSNREGVDGIRSFWIYYVEGFEDRTAGRAYCERFELPPNDCFVAEVF